MSRLVRLYASNLLKHDIIIAAGDNLKNLSLEPEDQLIDENLGIGTSTWSYLNVLEEEEDIKPFFAAVRSFYVKTITKMLPKFPFGDTLLKDLGVLQPEKASSYPPATIIRLAKCFPQIGLADSSSLDQLCDEFLDFSLSPGDLPTPEKYRAADKPMKPRAGAFWWGVRKLRTLDGEPRYDKLFKLMAGLLSIPVSNADSERGFSMLRKIHTDQRSNLDQSTLVALMSMKFNCDDCCTDIKLSSELLQKCKKATRSALGQL